MAVAEAAYEPGGLPDQRSHARTRPFTRGLSASAPGRPEQKQWPPLRHSEGHPDTKFRDNVTERTTSSP